ncbi:MAG TPA: hypothetical protein VJN29_17320 [Intrasporangium sp.]|uniref:hypothetical protein n=1 Tax=Intrasporangium sp. TaxID=1925024 RepID=UPI002B48C4F4|nr:hypothetical protein [Intrasporangium sp.]HKX68978.1 hypothetical protein [Intrasporangium sp.]
MGSRFTVGLVGVVVLLAGCSGSTVKISASAVDQAAVAIGGSARSLELTADDLSRLAAAGGVSEDVLRSTAPQADSAPLWQRTLRSAKTLDARTDGSVRDVALGVACDVSSGEIRSVEQLYGSLANQLAGLTESELQATAEATVLLWQDLSEAANSSDPRDRAAAVLACYTLESVS